MSCPSSQNPLILNVSMGNLPEGFCPATLQELANAIVARIIISPSEASLNISGGSTEPASNVGPWFKDCTELFVFDDLTSSYRAYRKGGFDTLEVKLVDGNFIVPANVYKIMVEGWGGGGAGATSGASVVGGGSAGAWGLIIRDVVPGTLIPFTVGVGGATGNPGGNGTASTILGMVIGGGSGGTAAGEPTPGGVATGADFNIDGGTSFRTSGTPGPGGDAPRGGAGGQLSHIDATYAAGRTPGGGGCGGNSVATGGNGAPGRLLIWY